MASAFFNTRQPGVVGDVVTSAATPGKKKESFWYRTKFLAKRFNSCLIVFAAESLC